MKTARDVLASVLASIVAVQSFACSGADKDASATAHPANASQAATAGRQEPANQRGLATYVQRYPNGYSLIRIPGIPPRISRASPNMRSCCWTTPETRFTP